MLRPRDRLINELDIGGADWLLWPGSEHDELRGSVFNVEVIEKRLKREQKKRKKYNFIVWFESVISNTIIEKALIKSVAKKRRGKIYAVCLPAQVFNRGRYVFQNAHADAIGPLP